MRIYETPAQASKFGWEPCSKVTKVEGSEFFSLKAARDMGAIRRIAQTVFVKFLCIVTCGKATPNGKVRHWQNEVREKKVFKTIFLVNVFAAGKYSQGWTDALHPAIWNLLPLARDGDSSE